MPTNRTRRHRRRVESDVIAALRTGAAVEFTPENHGRLVGAYYLGDYELTDAEKARARELFEAWRPLKLEHDRQLREPRKIGDDQD